MIYNAQIKLSIEKYKPLMIYYSYNENTTFQDLLEYIIYLIQVENICFCYKFSCYYNYNQYEIKDFNTKIKDYKDFLDNLYLSKNKTYCFCNTSKYLKSKESIINDYSNLKQKNFEQKNNINLLEQQKKNDEEKFEQLKKENNDFNQQISYLKQENQEQKNNINLLEKQKKSDKEKFEQLKKENNYFNQQISHLKQENYDQKNNINLLKTQKKNEEEKFILLKKENSVINREISLLKQENSEQKSNINLLEKQKKNDEEKFIQLKKENSVINQQISHLKQENYEQKNNINLLVKQKKNDEVKFEQLKKENNVFNQQISNLKKENSEQKNNINLLERQKKNEQEKLNLLKKENQDINQQISFLKQENSEQKNNINILEKQKKDEEKKFEQLKKENNDKNKQITYLIKENSEQKNNINILETQKKNDEKEKKDINEQISNLKQENSEQKNNIKILEENKRDMENKNQLLEIAVNGDYDKIVFLNENGITGKHLKLQDNIIKIDPKTNQFIGNEKNEDKKFIDFYDVIIHINSIKDLNKGWKIEISPKAKQNYENFKTQNIIKIGVIGNSNKGKSFLLSKISKIQLPSGTSIRTEGLSIKYPDLEHFENRKIALLDSAGLETPVLKFEKIENDKKKEYFKEKSREKLITELFLQNYIINNSDVLIAVVGILTYSEQKLIMKIKKEIERAKLEKPLFIIHNLIPYTSTEQVNKYIDEFLLNSATFTLIEGHKVSTKTESTKGRYFYEDNENQKIFHLIYANEGSEAGLYFNKFTLDFLENNYQNVIHLKPFDVIETIKERFIQISKDIIEKTAEEKFELDSFDDSNSEILKLKDDKEIILKKCLTDELGFSNFKANGFEPLYNLYKKNDELIILRVEAPGNCSLAPSTIEYAGEYNIIKISGEKKKDKEPQNINDNIYNTRENGKFAFDIPLKTEEYLLCNKEPKIIQKNGVFIIEYQLSKKINSSGYQMNEEDEI